MARCEEVGLCVRASVCVRSSGVLSEERALSVRGNQVRDGWMDGWILRL
jgi:hypothetical protein